MERDLAFYSRKFARLRVDRSRGIAPHKPILLLCVIELIQQGFINENKIRVTPELIASFLKYWNQLGILTHRPDIALPFFHLRGDGFWYLSPNMGSGFTFSSGIRVKTLSALQFAVDYAYLDDNLFKLLNDPNSRMTLAHVLISSWFKRKVPQVESLLKVRSFEEFQNDLLKKGGRIYKVEELQKDEETILRDAAFRRTVVMVYDGRCSICGLKVVNSLGQMIVDGAHIMPFADFHDDRIINGISLCKNHHWAFDKGWFGIADDHQILVCDDLLEESPYGGKLKDLHGQMIFLPDSVKFHPDPKALEWHRKYRFLS